MPITDKDLAASYLLRTFYAKAGVRVDPENPDGSLIEAEFDDVPTGVLEKVEQFGGLLLALAAVKAVALFTSARVFLSQHTKPVPQFNRQNKL